MLFFMKIYRLCWDHLISRSVIHAHYDSKITSNETFVLLSDRIKGTHLAQDGQVGHISDIACTCFLSISDMCYVHVI